MDVAINTIGARTLTGGRFSAARGIMWAVNTTGATRPHERTMDKMDRRKNYKVEFLYGHKVHICARNAREACRLARDRVIHVLAYQLDPLVTWEKPKDYLISAWCTREGKATKYYTYSEQFNTWTRR